MSYVRQSFFFYILIVLSSLSFYNPLGLIPSTIGKMLFYGSCCIAYIFALKCGININKISYPYKSYKLLLFGIILSIFIGSSFQEQSLKISFIATLPYFLGYMTFYSLMRLNVPKEKIEAAIWIFCLVSMIIYIINMLTFPNIIFGAEKDEYDMSRGIVRIGIRSLELIVLFFLYSINQWIVTKQKKYIGLIILTFLFIVLSVTRQYIFLSVLIGILFVIRKVSIYKRVIVICTCLAIYFFILPQIPIYNTMVELSEAQIERNETEVEDIRIQAWKFYVNEYQTNKITRIFGNGIPSIGNSIWGSKFEQTVSYDYGGNGCFYVDVGWAGFYWLFGLIATVALINILFKAVLKKKPENKQYLSYWCLFIILTSIASAPILFYNQIISIVTVLYLIYGKNNNYCNNCFKLQ